MMHLLRRAQLQTPLALFLFLFLWSRLVSVAACFLFSPAMAHRSKILTPFRPFEAITLPPASLAPPLHLCLKVTRCSGNVAEVPQFNLCTTLAPAVSQRNNRTEKNQLCVKLVSFFPLSNIKLQSRRLKIPPTKSVGRTRLFGGCLTLRQTPLLGRQNSLTGCQTALTVHVPYLVARQSSLNGQSGTVNAR